MTEAEAKELKPGDRVLVEATIREINNHMPEDGNIYIALNVVNLEHDEAWSCVRCEDIREKITPPRRKFRKEDIVAVKNEAIYYVTEDELEGVRVYLSATGEDTWDIRLRASMLTLVCAVENREDRKEGEV